MIANTGMNKEKIIQIVLDSITMVENPNSNQVDDYMYNELARSIADKLIKEFDPLPVLETNDCPVCGSNDLLKFKLEHIKCRNCKQQFECSC